MEPSEKFLYNPINGKPFKKIAKNLLKDEQTGYKFYISPKPAAAALITDTKDNLLLVSRAIEPEKGKWDMPGGFVDLDETVEEALKREVKEEIGKTVSTLKYFNSYTVRYLYGGINEYVLMLCFICKLEDYTNFKPQDDVKECKFFSKDAIPWDEIAFGSVEKALKDYIK